MHGLRLRKLFQNKSSFFLSCTGAMLLKDETQHVYETVKFWKIIPQIYRHMYTQLTTNEKPFQSQRSRRKKKQPPLPTLNFASQTDSLPVAQIITLLNYLQ